CRNRLAGDGEVRDCFRGLSSPQLPALGGAAHVTECIGGRCGPGQRAARSRPAASSNASHSASLTRGRPCDSPADFSAVSIASHPPWVTTGTPRSASSESIADASSPWPSAPPSASAISRSTVSVASFLFVPITPVGPRLIQPAQYTPASGAPSAFSTRPPSFGTVHEPSSNGSPAIDVPR